jgi:hypothetical protein
LQKPGIAAKKRRKRKIRPYSHTFCVFCASLRQVLQLARESVYSRSVSIGVHPWCFSTSALFAFSAVEFLWLNPFGFCSAALCSGGSPFSAYSAYSAVNCLLSLLAAFHLCALCVLCG